jgi:hypothetical protein
MMHCTDSAQHTYPALTALIAHSTLIQRSCQACVMLRWHIRLPMQTCSRWQHICRMVGLRWYVQGRQVVSSIDLPSADVGSDKLVMQVQSTSWDELQLHFDRGGQNSIRQKAAIHPRRSRTSALKGLDGYWASIAAEILRGKRDHMKLLRSSFVCHSSRARGLGARSGKIALACLAVGISPDVGWVVGCRYLANVVKEVTPLCYRRWMLMW